MITTSSSHLDWMLDYTAIDAGLVNRRQADPRFGVARGCSTRLCLSHEGPIRDLTRDWFAETFLSRKVAEQLFTAMKN